VVHSVEEPPKHLAKSAASSDRNEEQNPAAPPWLLVAPFEPELSCDPLAPLLPLPWLPELCETADEELEPPPPPLLLHATSAPPATQRASKHVVFIMTVASTRAERDSRAISESSIALKRGRFTARR
jgi:hypothetical protein